jgi:hypothetical protein
MKKFLFVIILIIGILTLVGCSPKIPEECYKNGEAILGYTFENNSVELNLEEADNIFYPQTGRFNCRSNNLHNVEIIQIGGMNRIYHSGNNSKLFLKKTDIEKIYSHFNLPIPENISILGQNNVQQTKEQTTQKTEDTTNSNGHGGTVLLIILGGIITIVSSVIGINKIYKNRISIEEKSYRDYKPYFYIENENDNVLINFNVKQLDTRYVATIPNNKANRRKVQKIKEKVTKIIDKATELKNYLSAVESAYNELEKNKI